MVLGYQVGVWHGERKMKVGQVGIYFPVSAEPVPGPLLSLPQLSFPQGRPGEICVIGPKGQKVSCGPGHGMGW